MPTLNIDGVGRVRVDDGFLSLSPEEQERTVDEIVSQAGRAKPAPAPEAPSPQTSAMEASNVGVLSGMTANFGDEIMAGLMTPIEVGIGAVSGSDEGKGIGERISAGYDRALEKNRAYEAQARDEHPIAATAGDIGGGLALGGQMMKGGATALNVAKPTYPAMIGRGAAEGAAYGGAYGAGAGEGVEDRVGGAIEGATVGAVTGGAMGALGARQASKAAKSTIPGVDDLRAAADDLYKQAEKAGLVVTPDSFGSMVDDVTAAVVEAGIDRGIHSKAYSALGRLIEAKDGYAAVGTGPILRDIDILRRVVKGAASSIDPDERRIASIMTEKVDDWLTNLKPQDVAAGNAGKAARTIRKARDLWSRMRKAEVVQDMMEKAENSAPNFSGSGMENAVRTQFRQLANNKKQMRQFSKAEQRAIRRVARGGPIENTLRMLGKFAPTGIVSSALSGGVGYTVGGPIGGVALPALGFGARQAATNMTMRNADLASQLMRSGGNLPGVQQLPGQVTQGIGALTHMGAQEIPWLLNMNQTGGR
jgi:hypothetical protein